MHKTLRKTLTLAACLAAFLAAAALPAVADPGKGEAQVTMVFDQPIASVPGKSLRGVLVEYGPGAFSAAHTHARSAFIVATVLEGSVRSRVNDGPEQVYRTGESFVEKPGDHHAVSANASNAMPAKLLAVFVVDTNDTKLTTPDGQ